MVRQQRRNSRRTLERKSISNVFDRREDDDNDTYNFRFLLDKILDIFEANDKHQLMKHTKQISGINVDGQELNSEMMRIKIEKNEYKSLKEFQDDFISIINNAILNNKENYDSGMKLLQFGSRLIEQAVKDVPPNKRRLENTEDEDDDDDEKSSSPNNLNSNSLIKGPQKIALMQPTTNGYVFSSVTMKHPILNNKFELVGELKEKVITPQESMSERDIPTLGSVLTKKINKSEQSTQSKDTTVPGVCLNSYKTYGSFAPIYNSRGAILSYEDTMMAYSYKQGKKDDTKTTESTPEENNIDHDVTKSDGNVLINSNSNESNEPTFQKENLAIAMSECFKDIDIDMIYESLDDDDDDDDENNCPITDKRLDENVVMISRLQMLQNKRFQTNPDIISSEERILSTKLKNRLAEMISVVPPSKLVSPGSIEKAMSQLPSREAAFKGTLPPNNNRAYPSNEISRDAFNIAVRPSETTQLTSTYSNSQMGNPPIRSTVMGPPPPPQSHPPQLKSEIPRTQSQAGYLQSPSHASRGYLPMNPQHGIPRHDGYYPGYHGYPTQYSPHLQRGYGRPNVGNSRSHIGNNLRPGY